MFEYTYKTIYTGGGFFMDNSSQEHREVIASYPAKGWRFVGFVPSRFTGNGGIKELDLVFEREAVNR